LRFLSWGGLICWLYVAQVAKNLETSKSAPSGTEQVTAVQQRDSGQARKAAADLPSAIAALNQGLHELAAGLDQVKQELQRERQRSVKETHQLAADLAQMQQSVLPKSEQARVLTEELAALTNTARYPW
jgi:septal ring factor EnvC (AmiA/AmiB activator)